MKLLQLATITYTDLVKAAFQSCIQGYSGQTRVQAEVQHRVVVSENIHHG